LAEEEAERQRILAAKRKAEEEKRQAEELKRLEEENVSNGIILRVLSLITSFCFTA
jgi:hypothetical protein